MSDVDAGTPTCELSAEEQGELEVSRAVSNARVRAFTLALEPSLLAREGRIAVELDRENSSGKSKLGKIYRLLADVGVAAQPFVECRKGCSACCKMNVSITSLEADRLAAASGKMRVAVAEPVKHRLREFSGVPCPFLVDDACSVYDSRPYACRSHYSFDTTPQWCQPDRSFVDGMGMIDFSEAKAAYYEIALRTPLGGFADIRDFFPTTAPQ